MKAPIRLLEYGVVPYLRSQAIYHAVADAMNSDRPDTVIMLVPDRPHFCIGFHQDPRQELDLEYCQNHDYPILRRRVGGGTTYLDSDQLYYQFVFHHRRAPAMVRDLYRYTLTPVVETLGTMGLDAELRDANEVVANGKRIAGTGAGRVGEASVVVGNFLIDFDYMAMADAWLAPNETYRRLAKEGLERYVTTLKREMGNAPGVEEIKSLLAAKMVQVFGRPLERGSLTASEKELELAAEVELSSRDRLFEVAGEPRKALKIADGVWIHDATCYLLIGGSQGELKVSARLRQQFIDDIAIEPVGGFGGRLWDVIAAALMGVPAETEAVRAPLERFQTAGLIPEEINLAPLVKTIVKFGTHDSH
jgi:lipoate---protein ligase